MGRHGILYEGNSGRSRGRRRGRHLVLPVRPPRHAIPDPSADCIDRAQVEELTARAQGPLTPMFYSYFLSASALAAVSLGAVLYTVTGAGDGIVEGAPAPTSTARGPELLIARYREQMKLTQETLSGLGYVSGPIDGIMGAGTAAALRAFQQQQGLRTTGRANPETLAALGIEDRLRRAP